MLQSRSKRVAQIGGRRINLFLILLKQNSHVLSLSEPTEGLFKVFGVRFDCALDMRDAVHSLASSARWKAKMVLRSRRYHCVADLVHLYKTHVLSFVEYRTPAIYDAKREYLRRLEDAQDHFLRDLGIDAESALAEFNLAPLRVRRDLAMLGLLHRTALGKGPRHFDNFFKC